MASKEHAPLDKGQGAGAEMGSDEVRGQAAGGGKSTGQGVQRPELHTARFFNSLCDLLQII